MNDSVPPDEREKLVELRALVTRLSDALNSLGTKNAKSARDSYTASCLVSILVASDAYHDSRARGAIRGSRLALRPALEALFNAEAALKSDTFLSRKAYTEMMDDKKLLLTDEEKASHVATVLPLLKEAFRERHPELPFEEKVISVIETAEMAGLSSLYQSHYRVFCQFTHGSVRAAFGNLGEIMAPFETDLVLKIVRHAISIVPEPAG